MTARLYIAPDSYGDETIWRDTGQDRDEAVLTRTGGNAAGFDALAGLVAMCERVEALADEWEADSLGTNRYCAAELRATLTPEGVTR